MNKTFEVHPFPTSNPTLNKLLSIFLTAQKYVDPTSGLEEQLSKTYIEASVYRHPGVGRI